ncbi:MAG: hypothetical protein GTO45_15355 [Candidatus Aminicenantes bacterium]|nr:hypothetical protein [Candidatus Aminicenantes bacterium]NIM80145.1 hypothetical protein [Candidatus Aminicenantes bacterium]NIN19483.1 hypothetical protein [Candidatus Aminicenantes bacterium]NIN43382.1 hypothetical protein [Candidatus Aminicenantes bacterium]NIN86127.1 hypothetical protein [Candidatus Aminicenantes bacterium]
MNNVIDITGLPPEAKESIINFYEFVRQKYTEDRKKELKSRKRLLEMMEKGLYKLPENFVFNRDELYDS